MANTTTTPRKRTAAKKTTAKKTAARRAAPRAAPLPVDRTPVAVVQAYAEKAVDVQVGAALTARDALVATLDDVRGRVATRESAEKELTRLSKRGTTARNRATRDIRRNRTRVERELRQRRNRMTRDVKRNRTRVEREVRSLRKDAEQQLKDVRTQVRDIQIPQVPNVVAPVREAVKPLVDRFAA